MRLRVLHQPVAPSGSTDVADYVVAAREAYGCLEAEAYVSLDDSTQLAVTELWEDLDAYATHWRRVLDAGSAPACLTGSGQATSGSGSELYRQRPYTREAGTWTPVGGPDEAWRVQWPARGPVRVLIATDGSPTRANPWPGGAAALAETRREPGCRQFEVFVGIEHPQDGLLLELWDDQARYDAHWRLRTSTRETGRARDPGGQERPQPTPRGHGANTVEFYRHETFVHLYDRWLPARADAWSSTVRWAD